MAVVYLDSSVLVSIAFGDSRGSQASTLLASRNSCTSELTPVECQSALSFHYSAASADLRVAEEALEAVLAGTQLIQVTSSVLAQARTLIRRYRSGLGLRTLDALHVASCTEMQTQLGPGAIEYITADRRQHNAFTAEGFHGTLLS